jgi:hypothetical protein
MYVIVYLFTKITWDRFLKKRRLKRLDSNLETFNYESDILTIQPTFSSVILCLNNNLNSALVHYISELLGLNLAPY